MIVELLDRRGAVRQRVRLRAFPATIGRGYDNDVILDDRHVDVHHAQVTRNGLGGLVLLDQGSVNGLIDPPSGRRSGQVPLQSGTEVRLGRTVLRFVDPSAPLEAAVPLPTGPDDGGRGPATLLARPLWQAALILGTGLLLGANRWLESTSRVRVSGLLGEALTSLLVVVVWAGAWALVNRITQQRFRFLEHLAIPCVVLATYVLATDAGEWLQFLVPEGVDWDFMVAMIVLASAVWGLAAHLARVATISRPARWLWSMGVIGGLAGIAALASDGDHREFGGSSDEAPLKPLSARWIPTTTPARFLTRVEELKQEVDDLGSRMDEQGAAGQADDAADADSDASD